MAGLRYAVHFWPEGGEFTTLLPGDDVPEEVARTLGAHCFEDGVHHYPDEPAPEPAAKRTTSR